MTADIARKDLQAIVSKSVEGGFGPGAILDSEWDLLRKTLNNLLATRDWSGIVDLRNLFTPLLAADSAWGIPVIQLLDEKAIEAAHKLGAAAELGHLYGARGHNLHRQGFHRQAISSFEESVANYHKVGDSFSALKSEFMTSLCYRALGNRSKAKEILTNVLERADHDDPWRGNPLQVLAWLFQDDGDLPKSEELLREVLSLHEKATDGDILVAGTLADLGEVVGLQGNYPKAREFFLRSLSILDLYRGQYERQVARTKLKYAQLEMRKKDISKALLFLDEADDHISSYGHYYDLMWRIELTRAMIFFRMAQLKKALSKFIMVLRFRRFIRLPNWLLLQQLGKYLLGRSGLPR